MGNADCVLGNLIFTDSAAEHWGL